MTETFVTTEATGAWDNQRIVVAGMARSGRAAARLLLAHGARVTITDLRSAEALELDEAAWRDAGFALALGGHPDDLLDGADLLVLSPGIPKTASLVLDADRRGVPRLGEMEIAAQCAKAPMLAVTGTNGKSTVVTLTGGLLDAFGVENAVAGNVGRALSEVVETIPASGVLAVEVSSYQLEDVDGFHPVGAALLNITPDHLDRYDSLVHYGDTKWRLFDRQTADDVAVFPADNDAMRERAADLESRLVFFGDLRDGDLGARVTDTSLVWRDQRGETEILGWDAFPLPGAHNRNNAAAAVALTSAAGIDPRAAETARGLAAAKSLSHRLETVAVVGGVPCVDDSKATNPESLEVALGSFDRPVILLAGGLPKDDDYGRLTPLLCAHAAEIVLIGDGETKLSADWASTGLPIHKHGKDFPGAIRFGWERARALGGVLLLSPGCASFDMFRDYEERGDRFAALVRQLEDRG